MTRLTRTITALLLFLPLTVLAAPGPVHGIAAVNQNGSVHVSWQSAGADVVRYDVYVSRRSIVHGSGAYDDVESTVGSRTEHVLTDLPATSGTLYVSVLGVDASGAESTFVEEAQVDLGASSSPAASTLQMLSANVRSMTGILLTFNAPVSIPRDQAAQAFSVTYGSGKSLLLRRIEVTGATVLLTTAPQELGRLYHVNIRPVIQGRDAMGNPSLPMDPFMSTTDVLGGLPTLPNVPASSASSVAAVPTTSSASSAGSSASTAWVPQPSPVSVLNLHLRAQRIRKGLSRITATWETSGGSPASFTVRQSRDRGITFGQAKNIPGTARMAQVDDVPSGTFGLSIQPAGGIPVFQSIDTGTKTGPLTDSGLPALLPLLVAGAGAGLHYSRRSSRVRNA